MLDLLNYLPALLAEAGDIASMVKKFFPGTTVAVFQRVAVLPLGVMLVRRMSLHCVTAFPAAACYPVPVMARSRAL